MRLLLFCDLHGSDRAFLELKEKAAKADTIVCGGDITIFGDGLNTMLRKLASLKKPVILIPGNHESPDELERACQKFDTIYNVHKKTMLFNGVLFQGYGGGGFSYTYPELEALSKKFLRDKLKDTPLVFLSHAPPYKTAVDDICGEPSGSKTLRNLIQVLKPTLVVCGHIHENAGKEDTVGTTVIINPGPYGKIVTVVT